MKYKLRLLTWKTYTDGTSPIALQFIVNQKRKVITLGLNCKPDHWSEETSRIKNGVRNFKRNNKTLDFFQDRADRILVEFQENGIPFHFDTFKARFEQSEEVVTVVKFFDLIMNELEDAGKVNTRNVYKTAKNRLVSFIGETDVQFSSVNYSFLKEYESYLFSEGCSGGGVHHHMRSIRAIFNEAIKRGVTKQQFYPFSTQFNKSGYSLSQLKSKAAPRALSEIDFKKLRSFDYSIYPMYANSFHYFMFSYFSRGMNFVDMAKLKWKDIYGGRITYNRSKTSGGLNIKISSALEVILSKFPKGDSEYVFPILSESHETPSQKSHRIKKCLKKYNADLNKIAQIQEIEVHLTSYVARHTYATTLKRKGVSTELISEGLGHSEISTTKHYLEKFSNDLLDESETLL